MEASLKPPGVLDFSASNLAFCSKKRKEEFKLYTDLALREEADTGKVKKTALFIKGTVQRGFFAVHNPEIEH